MRDSNIDVGGSGEEEVMQEFLVDGTTEFEGRNVDRIGRNFYRAAVDEGRNLFVECWLMRSTFNDNRLGITFYIIKVSTFQSLLLDIDALKQNF